MLSCEAFFDPATSTLTYLVVQGRDAVVIDPVWDFDPLSWTLSQKSLQTLLTRIEGNKLKVHAVLETHMHADHMTAASLLRQRYRGCQVAISERIRQVQATFRPLLNVSEETGAEAFDVLLKDRQELKYGEMTIRAHATPGHTPACVSYEIGDMLFTGDALFMPDSGTGRTDFPGGSAVELYQSIHERIYQFPDSTRIFVGHDYQPQGRPLRYQSTVGEEKSQNIHLQAATTQEAFVAMRTGRDKTLSPPRLLYPSLQINLTAGMLPPANAQGQRFLQLPLFEQR